MISIQKVCGKAILICLILILIGRLFIYDGIYPFKGLASIYGVNEAMVHA